jgi:hypothetical protein
MAQIDGRYGARRQTHPARHLARGRTLASLSHGSQRLLPPGTSPPPLSSCTRSTAGRALPARTPRGSYRLPPAAHTVHQSASTPSSPASPTASASCHIRQSPSDRPYIQISRPSKNSRPVVSPHPTKPPRRNLAFRADCRIPAHRPVFSHWRAGRSLPEVVFQLANSLRSFMRGTSHGFRKHGAQRLRITAPLPWAIERGCDLATTTTQPGSTSPRNLERAGFQLSIPARNFVRNKS